MFPMSEECHLRDGVELNLVDVEKIALGLKSLATYSMLAYEHDDDPEELDEIVQEGLDAIDRLFNC
ncbi:MAG: ribonuclease H [Candidatus Thiodiazotropha endolucinida]